MNRRQKKNLEDDCHYKEAVLPRAADGVAGRQTLGVLLDGHRSGTHDARGHSSTRVYPLITPVGRPCRKIWVWLVIVSAALWALTSQAVESWSDERLPVKQGLVLWFDCSHQYAGRGALRMPPLFSGNQTDYLIDGSGQGHHLTQPVAEARPVFHQEFNGAYLSFNGAGNALFAFNLREQFTNVTIFVVANVRANKGGFPCLFSLASMGENDYRTGLNLDLGPVGTPQLSQLNLEGGGMSGMVNLLKDAARPFGSWHIFSLETKPGTNGSRLFLDGTEQRTRDRDPSEIHLGAFVMGARLYSNGGPPPFLQGFHSGEIAEFLLYDHCLSEADRAEIQTYLKRKYSALLERGPEYSGGGKPLSNITNPPAFQMFVPGFSVRPIPLSLPNINNVKYRSDGKLVALGYNGYIYLLSASNGGNLENHADLFWTNNSLRAPIGMALTPPGYARGQGVFVAAKGKLSLIVDTNGDDRADAEIVVAEGWKELSHGVDALGVALDHDGNIYFGLGAANFTDPYLIDKATGAARYDLHSERGTILKVSPDFQHREILCTGIRFSVALAFNRRGDLFCTDQEGATWLSNGNPFDELLHIERGRHYGFPPQHPKYLQNVIDEPSVFDYGPQHQSTCGLNFNNSVNGGPVFGPAWWADNAIISGYSRGKIWRTELAKTKAGYVARTRQIASLNALTVDACISPQGDLVVSTHSGDPDWGSGPNGYGHLYKVTYMDSARPQPTMAWHNSPSEIRMAFDRALDPEALRNLARRAEVTQGKYVSAGDRFEVVHPGYAAVISQFSEPRYDVPIESAALSADRRTLILNTKPHNLAVNYGVTLAGWNSTAAPAHDTVSQYPDMELLTDLSGIQADWTPQTDNSGSWHGWLPHVDLEVARQFTVGSSEHQVFWQSLAKAGRLELRGQLRLWEMLQPAIQPGSKLDYDRPRENVTVVFSAIRKFRARFGISEKESSLNSGSRHEVAFDHISEEDLIPFDLSISSGGTEPGLSAVWFTEKDSRRRAFPLHRFFVPWAGGKAEAISSKKPRELPGLAGGNWLRGKNLFFSEPVNCQRCHSIHGQGHRVGPDLSNLIFRDYASVLRDIMQPNATLNPDYIAYNIQLKNGDDLTAVLQTETPGEITVVDANAHITSLHTAEIASLKPSAVSFMPENLLQGVDTNRLKDLMTFLLTLPLEPADVRISGEPPPRKEIELEAALKPVSSLLSPHKPKSLNIVLCAGTKDHGEAEHDYPLWQKRWLTLMSQNENVHPEKAWEWPTPEQFQAADVLVFYSGNPGWKASRADELEAFLSRGKGLVFVHLALDGHQEPRALARVTGLAWQNGVSKYRHGPLHLTFSPNPIVPGPPCLDLADESYWSLIGDPKDITVIASSTEDGQSHPQAWAREYKGGRVFVCIPGHYVWTFDDPIYRALLFRGICWASGAPPDYLADLICIGARVTN